MYYEYGPAGKVIWGANKVIEGINNARAKKGVQIGSSPISLLTTRTDANIINCFI